MVYMQGVEWSILRQEINSDSLLQQITLDLQYFGFSLVKGKLFYKGGYVKEFHDSAVGGHSRDLKTYLRAADLYWHGMRKGMASYVFECGIHQ